MGCVFVNTTAISTSFFFSFPISPICVVSCVVACLLCVIVYAKKKKKKRKVTGKRAVDKSGAVFSIPFCAWPFHVR
jgi:hypothetical protein